MVKAWKVIKEHLSLKYRNNSLKGANVLRRFAWRLRTHNDDDFKYLKLKIMDLPLRKNQSQRLRL